MVRTISGKKSAPRCFNIWSTVCATGLKNEVIVPLYSRNVYDHAIRAMGAKIIDVATVVEFRAQ